MARSDGSNRLSARNVNLTKEKIGNAQRHNEREKESYANPDIVKDRSEYNIHFKTPADDYDKMFAQLEAGGVISTRGLKVDANLCGELIFDVNSAYFDNHGGYEYAKQFYADAYKAAIQIVGGEEYILSAVMHADERNRAMSDALGRDVYHYHMHVVYIPVVEKQILWSKRCRDPALVGTVKETVMQVSSSKKWLSKPATEENGDPILQKNGKPVLRKSYSVLQDDFYKYMLQAGYLDVERGERGSSEEHLTVTQFKVAQEQQRLSELETKKAKVNDEVEKLTLQEKEAQKELSHAQTRIAELAPAVNGMEKLANLYSGDPDSILPEPGTLESAKTYREKKAKPLLARIVKVMRSVYRAYLDLLLKFKQLQDAYNRETDKNSALSERIETLSSENRTLRETAREYAQVKTALGPEHVEAAAAEARLHEAKMKQVRASQREKQERQ